MVRIIKCHLEKRRWPWRLSKIFLLHCTTDRKLINFCLKHFFLSDYSKYFEKSWKVLRESPCIINRFFSFRSFWHGNWDASVFLKVRLSSEYEWFHGTSLEHLRLYGSKSSLQDFVEADECQMLLMKQLGWLMIFVISSYRALQLTLIFN